MKKDPTKKLSIQEYLKLRELQGKKRFRLQLYPLPVLIPLLIPLTALAILLLAYFFHIKNIIG